MAFLNVRRWLPSPFMPRFRPRWVIELLSVWTRAFPSTSPRAPYLPTKVLMVGMCLPITLRCREMVIVHLGWTRMSTSAPIRLLIRWRQVRPCYPVIGIRCPQYGISRCSQATTHEKRWHFPYKAYVLRYCN